MKKVVITHGWGDNAGSNWIPWLKSKLEAVGINAMAISIPDSEHPNLEGWVNYLNQNINDVDEDTILVGHSLGGITILRYIENLSENIKLGGIVLVSSFAEPIGWPEPDSFCQTEVDFDKVNKIISGRSIIIHSDNDKYVSNIVADNLRRKLKGEFIVIHNGGHLTSRDGYTEFPDVYNSIKKLI